MRSRLVTRCYYAGVDYSPKALVRACIRGEAAAWDRLLDDYGRLIWSIARRAGLNDEEAEEVFQRSWVAIVEGLSRLKKPDRLGSWIAATTRHQVYRFFSESARHRRSVPLKPGDEFDVPSKVEEALEDEQRNQAMRESVDRLANRCRTLLRLLFFEDPPLDYESVAERTGLAIGSIGPIRARCLTQVKKIFDRLYHQGHGHDY